uniref:Uncharacterized protein n=1 Tax=uncultured prokaryote TaxID=198431 RepID=A0A0H5Q1S0_9ZZZZ|nr:hypothetical protein [uncultured prokaryote]
MKKFSFLLAAQAAPASERPGEAGSRRVAGGYLPAGPPGPRRATATGGGLFERRTDGERWGTPRSGEMLSGVLPPSAPVLEQTKRRATKNERRICP